LLPDPAVITLYGEPTLLMHGDLLCSEDTAYQAFRAMVRNPAWQEQFLDQPLAARQEFAAKARAASKQHQSGATESIMDVTPATVAATMSRHGVSRLIHGHTHRPKIHSLTVNERRAQRFVLGDWYTQGSVLRADADGFELAALS
jgi:UDP-2,3-diacylglucosamine hydrolase